MDSENLAKIYVIEIKPFSLYSVIRDTEKTGGMKNEAQLP
jgi:hypothetical protein